MDFKTKPFPHQLEEFNLSRDATSRALFWEMGCGKTKPTIDTIAWLYMQGKINAAIVLAPAAVAPNWSATELPDHLPDHIAKTTKVVLWNTRKVGTQRYQHEIRTALEHKGLLIVCMSYDGLMQGTPGRAHRVKNIKRAFKGVHYAKEVLTTRETMVVLDESARIKDPSTKRTKRTLAMGPYAKYRRILTGTPIANSPFDIFAQVQFLDPHFWQAYGCRGWPAFKQRFGVWVKKLQNPGACPHKKFCFACGSANVAIRPDGSRRCRSCENVGEGDNPADEFCGCPKFDMLVKYRNLDQLNSIVDGVGSRLLKSEVLDLPPKMYSKRRFSLPSSQRKVYDQLRTEMMVMLEGGDMITAPLVITQLLRLQQITSGYCPTDDGEMMLAPENARLGVLGEIVQDCPHKLIVWAKFKHDFELIGDMLRRDKVPFVEYHGAIADQRREYARTAFQKDDQVKVFLGNPACAGEGLTLHAAQTVVYYNTAFKLDARLQSEDRAHRIGQEHPVQYIDIVAEDTVDDKIIEALASKKNIADLVMGDPRGGWI